jgi:hypothetical protein
MGFMSTAEDSYGAGTLASARERASALADAVSRYVVGSVPALTGETLAVGRVFFGGLILFFWAKYNPNILDSLARNGPLNDATRLLDQSGILTLLSASAVAREVVYWSTVWLLVAFILGIFTRFLYPLLVGLMWLAVFMKGDGHFVTPLMLGMTVTIGAPWSARWSVDSLLWRPREPSVASPYHGYALWLLGFTIGLTYFTAGISKLVLTNGAWLWDTGARMGFIQDMRDAGTDWGIFLSNSYLLALGASFHSAFGQMVYVWASFTRSPVIKYGIGLLIAFPFLLGLLLLMGLFWWPWFVLVLVLYCPWPTIDRILRPRRVVVPSFVGSPSLERHRAWLLACVAGLVLVHAYAVVSKVEFDPLYSNYPMYAAPMRAGSEAEVEFWDNFKKADKHFKYAVRVVSVSETGRQQTVRDLSDRFSLANVLKNASLWRLPVTRLQPSSVLEIATAGREVGQSICEQLQETAADYIPSRSTAQALQYGKRYYELANGTMAWLPVAQWIEVDITNRDCAYRRVAGDAESASLAQESR